MGIHAQGMTPNDTSCNNNIVCRIAKTSDKGKTWTKLPAGAPGTFMEEPVRMGPDGTFYSIQTNVEGGPVNPSDQDVFKLAPGSDGWTPVTSTQLEHYPILTLSWDEQGHPVALWAQWALSGVSSGKQFAPGIAYHRA